MTDSTIKHIATVFPISAEALKPDPKFHRRRSIIREFSLNTSTHGIPGIARSETIPNRIFWTISLLAFTGIMLFFIIASIRDYFSYPTQTLVSIVDEWPLPFPAVTICNYSPLRYDTFVESFLNYTNSRNLTNTTNTEEFSHEQADYIRDFLQYKLNNGESIDDYLFSLDSMLMSCIYNGKNCSKDDFTSFLSPFYGLCYTLNAKNDRIRNGTLFYNTDNGGFGLLQLQLYVHSQQYIPYFSDAVGLIAMVHDNREMPVVDLNGVYLGAGRKHRVAFTKRSNHFLGPPYSECSDNVPYMLKATFNRFGGTDYAYAQFFCYRICMQIFIYATCGCINPFQWSARSIVLPGSTEVIDAPLCNLTDSCYNEAAERFQVEEWTWIKYCSECPPECTSINYLLKLSSLTAPPDWMMTNVKTFVESSSVPLSKNWSTTWPLDIAKNYISLDVACETSRVETYTAVETTSGIDLLSNVGGHTGLWIGISFLSLMELVEMLYRLIRYHYFTLRKKLQKRKRKTNNEQM